MNDAGCEYIVQECVEEVRKALKTLTSGEIYDRKGHLNEAGYKALQEIDGLDLFWICDPLIEKVDAKRPTGKWIDHWSEDLQKMGFRQCSKCKAGYQIYEHGTRKSDLSWIDGQQYTLKRICNFCPNCGAKMDPNSSGCKDK